MAKYYGSAVKIGKIGGSVFRVRFGETIESQYQPNVTNPNSSAQIEQRAKFKLAAQLATVVAPVIAMPRAGSSTSRNEFVKRNFRLMTYENETAKVNLPAVQLTKSVVALPAVNATREGNQVTLAMAAPVGGLSRVVYCIIEEQSDGAMRLIPSQVVSTAGTGNTWSTTVQLGSGDSYTILAYGVRDNTEAARVLFSEMEAVSAESIAHVIVTRTLTEADVTLTETRGVHLS